MIFDSFQNIQRYPEIPYLKEILAFVSIHDCREIIASEIEIKGRELFVRVAEYLPEPANNKQFEAHQLYADLQWVIKGQEVMQSSAVLGVMPLTPYDSEADIQFFDRSEDFSSLVVSEGEFVFFFPRELHRPGCQVRSGEGSVKKLVFKIKMG